MTEPTPDLVSAAGPPNSRRAVVVGLLGVGSLPGLLFCGIGAVLGVISLVLAPSARREIEASGGALGGLGIVRVARICSVVSIVLAVLAIVVVVVVAVFLLPDHTY